jgi:hypothetical protein
MTYDEWLEDYACLADDPRVNCCRHAAHHVDIETALKDCPECEAEPPINWSEIQL